MEMGDLFVIYSFVSTIEIFGCLIMMLTTGAKINDLDLKLKENLIKINKDVGRMRAYDANEKIYQADSKIYILN